MELLIFAIVVFALLGIGVTVVIAKRRSETPESGPAKSKKRRSETTEALRGNQLSERLGRTRSAIGGSLAGLFGSSVDVEWGDLEDALILADVGPTTAGELVAGVRRRGPGSESDAAVALSAELRSCFGDSDRSLTYRGSPAVIVVVGVNGAGKTTTIGKIASNLVASGTSVILGAADTFRAAADSQLIAWGDRAGVEVVAGTRGQDPASVAFSAIERAKTDHVDVVIVDTAGRLHAHTNLMDELAKLVRVTEREAGEVSEVLLVLDGSTGQNGLAQARAFTDAVGVTAVVLTKLDGSAKGGVAVAVEKELGLPIKYIGIGEGAEDLIPFDPDEFVQALIAP